LASLPRTAGNENAACAGIAPGGCGPWHCLPTKQVWLW
jgi:hypothetical protein